MRIPHSMLLPETLNSLVGQYVSQLEGNDFDPTPIEERIEFAKKMLNDGQVILLFSEHAQEPFIITKTECIQRFGSIPAYIEA
ncbi:YheU family protein [Vibrio coralliirubri]|uniref:YheU family protein n=1 Tax=Vibrio coralliirubri TaxID=1516159 RepID=UPI00228474FC|nr:YheU family protein [Vibrio coralliirubri]MCY9861340.1 YheU family protein [Vibrio coralliirubri]